MSKVLHKLRIIAGFALLGSVLTGLFFGGLDLSFDPRTLGASAGALLAVVKVLHII
ncbi:hypothetical protein [Imbroritus primus]|uniref:hypothetical protein n=1 Tax=Imbroritus primus TaxID=3058603 RepID=UPI0002698470